VASKEHDDIYVLEVRKLTRDKETLAREYATWYGVNRHIRKDLEREMREAGFDAAELLELGKELNSGGKPGKGMKKGMGEDKKDDKPAEAPAPEPAEEKKKHTQAELDLLSPAELEALLKKLGASEVPRYSAQRKALILELE